MGVKLEVVLDPKVPLYSGGQEVMGFVKVTVDAVTACKAILARATGVATVAWEEDDTSRKGTETYLDNTVTVWSGASYGENLVPGEFHLPFCFKLPDNLPPSYEGLHGHIRYSVEARNEVQWGAVKHAITRFAVSATQDLNADPKLAEPLPLRKEETVCCWCCEEGPLIISLTAEKGGYVPGEYILLTGEITNRTTKVVENATVGLYQDTTFYASGHQKKQKDCIQKFLKPGFGEGRTDVWLSVPIRIPDYVLSLDSCSIISIEYSIKVTFSVGGYWDVAVDNTFQVGTIPIGRVAFALDGEPESNLRPSAPPLYPTLKPSSPIQEQPHSLPAPTDPLSKGNKGGGGEGTAPQWC